MANVYIFICHDAHATNFYTGMKRTRAARAGEPAKSNEPAKPVKSVKPAKPVKPVKPAKVEADADADAEWWSGRVESATFSLSYPLMARDKRTELAADVARIADTLDEGPDVTVTISGPEEGARCFNQLSGKYKVVATVTGTDLVSIEFLTSHAKCALLAHLMQLYRHSDL
jgi:hypothetical protein